jgi:hypothetical protein
VTRLAESPEIIVSNDKLLVLSQKDRLLPLESQFHVPLFFIGAFEQGAARRPRGRAKPHLLADWTILPSSSIVSARS